MEANKSAGGRERMWREKVKRRPGKRREPLKGRGRTATVGKDPPPAAHASTHSPPMPEEFRLYTAERPNPR